MCQGEVSRGLASIIDNQSMLDPLQTSCWFALCKASYFPTGEETPGQAVGCIWCEV